LVAVAAFLAGAVQGVHLGAGLAGLGADTGRLALTVFKIRSVRLAFLAILLVDHELAQHFILPDALNLLSSLGNLLLSLDLAHAHYFFLLGMADEEAIDGVFVQVVIAAARLLRSLVIGIGFVHGSRALRVG
jgi:hypothetical protein